MFSEVYDGINSLSSKGFIIKSSDKYKVSDKFSLYNDLLKYAVYTDISYEKANYDEKLDVLYSKDKILGYIGKFAEIKDQKECFLVKYD